MNRFRKTATFLGETCYVSDDMLCQLDTDKAHSSSYSMYFECWGLCVTAVHTEPLKIDGELRKVTTNNKK